jgi:hypothetical protein
VAKNSRKKPQPKNSWITFKEKALPRGLLFLLHFLEECFCYQPRASITAFICSGVIVALGARTMPLSALTDSVAAIISNRPASICTNSTRPPVATPNAAPHHSRNSNLTFTG